MRNIFGLLLLVILCQTAKAQENFVPNPILHQKSIELNAGSQGLGAEFGYGLMSRLALRLGVNVIPTTSSNSFHFSGINSISTVTAAFSNVHLLADFTPFKGARGIRLVTGAAYFMRANGNVEFQPTDTYNYGDIALTKENIGKVNINADWKGIAPYAGIGLAKMFPSRVFNVNLDLGTYYLNQPNAQVVGTGMLVNSSSQTAQVQSNIRGYRFLPVVQLNFNFKL